MKPIESLTKTWFRGRGSSTRDLYALGVLAITARGNRALVVPGVIGVLLLATLREGGWFRKGVPVRHRRGGCSAGGAAERVR